MKKSDIYLFFYNTVQVLGWSTIFVKTTKNLLLNQSLNVSYYKDVDWELQVFQTAAILEIFHIAFGLVRSPLGTTIAQVFSRVTVVWLILFKISISRSSIGVPMLLMAWSITEVTRYSFYALNLIKSVPFFLIWMRYTFFIVLYPLGASGEILTMIASLPEIQEKKHFTYEMPNSFNFGFSFYYFVIILCLIYIPGFPKLYGYMFVQRKKVLSDSIKKKT